MRRLLHSRSSSDMEKICLVLSVLVAVACGEVVPFQTCPGVSSSACSIKEVRVNPCAQSPQACRIRLGRNADISFDFTPNFSAARLENSVETGVNGEVSQLNSLPVAACGFTPCPAPKDTQQTYNYNLHISKIWPKGAYSITWRLWNADNKDEQCCFTIDIKLK